MASPRFLFGILVATVWISFPTYVLAGPVLEWNPSTGDVSGYRILFGTQQEELSESQDVGNITQYPLNDLPLKDSTTYYFKVRAYNDFGESPDSNRISWTSGDSTPPIPPQNLVVE